jgi:hypothetical protein
VRKQPALSGIGAAQLDDLVRCRFARKAAHLLLTRERSSGVQLVRRDFAGVRFVFIAKQLLPLAIYTSG